MIYGLLGAATSIVFNINISPSITRMGQSLVSSAAMMFEGILANNVKFGSLEHVLTFINNIKNERPNRKFKDSEILLSNKTPKEVFTTIILTCGFQWIPSEDDMEIIWRVIENLDQEDLNRVYYKNNLYEFMENSIVKKMVINLLKEMKVPYLNPLKPPKDIIPQLDLFTEIMQEYVYYKYMIPDRIDRMANMVKSICLISDTDSTIISMDAWYRYILENVKGMDMEITKYKIDPISFIKFDEFDDLEKLPQIVTFVEPNLDYDFYEDDIIEKERVIDPISILPQDNLRYSIINILAYFLDRTINDYMEEFTKYSGSYDEARPCKILMKNEFLMKRALLTSVKKSYASILELQEGHKVPKEESLDVKGIAAIKKRSMSLKTREALSRILYEDILNSDEIDQVQVIKHIAIEGKKIWNSLRNGERYYLKPDVIKSASSYENPMRIQGIKASEAWNLIKEDSLPAINLSERNSIDIAKVNITKQTIEQIKEKCPEAYEHAMNNIFNGEGNSIYKGKVDAIAIPSGIDIPLWIRELIDYNTIISNNLSGFPIESIGVQKYASNNVYTNIVKL